MKKEEKIRYLKNFSSRNPPKEKQAESFLKLTLYPKKFASVLVFSFALLFSPDGAKAKFVEPEILNFPLIYDKKSQRAGTKPTRSNSEINKTKQYIIIIFFFF